MESLDVGKIAFTGSTRVGRLAASMAGEQLKPVTMELGGNAAHIVFEDADVEKAIGAIIKGFVFNTGQFCMAGPRLLVHSALYDTALGILTDGAESSSAASDWSWTAATTTSPPSSPTWATTHAPSRRRSSAQS